MSDDQLVFLVKQALDREPELLQTTIAVSAMNGVIELTGYVRNEAQREKARQIAQGVEGVRSVINNLHL